ncbi:MAG: PIN domain-containing protein [Pyrinomonadaceae bacterium]|nr:PIN domain-containing protein [Pyrinomonadaceae bacterium]
MSKFLPDTNVFAKIFGNDPKVKQFVESLDAVIDATIYIECIQGSKSNREKRVIEKYLTRFPLLPITSQSSLKALELIRSYSNSHGLFLPDALIAASALENDLTVLTYNINDFKFIQDLKYLKPTV